MSRFFTAGDSSSESESSGEEELYSEEEEIQGQGAASDDDESESEEESDEDDDDSDSSSDDGGRTGAAKFLRDQSSESEDSDEDQPKVVKSAKDKRLEEMDSVIKVIENAKKIGDWSVISTEFDKLNRQVTKVAAGQKAPKQYIKEIADLEDLMNETLAKQKVTPKKMNATNARGLNAMKQKIKKNNKDFDDEIKKYRDDKDGYMESDEEEDVPVQKPSKSDIFITRPAGEAADVDDNGFETVGKGGRTLQYTPESILSHLRAINESRGRKNTDRAEQIRIMERLLSVAQTSYQKIRVLLTVISTRFDLISHSSSGYMSQESWKQADNELGQLLEVLETHRDIIVVESAEAWEDDEKQPTLTPGETFKIPGSIVSIFERLDDELTRSLQHIDPHTAEYIERLQDEQALYNKLLRGQIYVEAVMKDHLADLPAENLNRMIIRRIEHVYFKPSQVIAILEKNAWTSVPAAIDSAITPRSKELSPSDLMSTLCMFLFEKSEHIIRGRAFLCQVYYVALHDQYHKARDMMLMSHLQENIPNFDISTQILFNRTLVQIGLCAFRAGLVYDAQTTLQDICGSGRQKELLAQGVVIQRYVSVSPEQERLERQRQLPFHMHINLELLECVYLTCSMLLEIPLMAQMGSSPDIRKRVISKTFRRHFDFHERQIFTGPPENTRDHIMQASKALAIGEWKRSVELIESIKIWELVAQAEKIKEMLKTQIQEEGLRTYLFTYASYYDTLGMDTLAEMFELPQRRVTAIVSKMISNDELAAALDQVNSAIIFRKGVELSRLQSLALTLSEKASGLIESNERTLEQRTSGLENRFERQGGQRQRGGRTGRGGAPRTGQRTRGGQQFGGGALGSAIKA